jgi:hypothetical protein
MMNISVTKLPHGNDLVLCFMTFLGLIYGNLDRHRFYGEYIFHYIYDIFSHFITKVSLTRTFYDDGLFVTESSQQ